MKFLLSAALVAALSLVINLAPATSFACACGCGIFDVGDGTLMPTDSTSNLTVWFRYDYMDQNQNWEGASKAAGADNTDKNLKSSFFTIGGQYMINRDWTVMADLPIVNRSLTTTDDGTVFGAAGGIYTGKLTSLGDLQLMATYTGFAPDMSSGVTFGVKLPTGDFTGPIGPKGGPELDRDTLPGTGSTDLIVGGYHIGKLSSNGALSYFVQAKYEFAVATQDGYRPGDEFDGAIGVSYDVGTVGPVSSVTPVLQLLDSTRAPDSGPNADPLNTGYERLLIAPGLSMRVKKVRIYADVELPIYQRVNAASSVAINGTSGQLVAPALFKLQFGYDF